jgi:hypothetical protein
MFFKQSIDSYRQNILVRHRTGKRNKKNFRSAGAQVRGVPARACADSEAPTPKALALAPTPKALALGTAAGDG